MEPSNFEHWRVASTSNWLLGVRVRGTGTGVTLGAETEFILARDPDTVLARGVGRLLRLSAADG